VAHAVGMQWQGSAAGLAVAVCGAVVVPEQPWCWLDRLVCRSTADNLLEQPADQALVGGHDQVVAGTEDHTDDFVVADIGRSRSLVWAGAEEHFDSSDHSHGCIALAGGELVSHLVRSRHTARTALHSLESGVTEGRLGKAAHKLVADVCEQVLVAVEPGHSTHAWEARTQNLGHTPYWTRHQIDDSCFPLSTRFGRNVVVTGTNSETCGSKVR
jgi:hypothetical protein